MIAYHQAQKSVQRVAQQVAHAADQLQLHGFDRYYNAMVGAYVSEVYKTLSYKSFIDATNRAKTPLSSIEQAVMYTTLYGKNHFDRFNGVITQVLGDNQRTESVTKTINIVDYGCGQAIASLALLSYLEQYVNCENFTLNFYLIEPSQTTLELAELLVTKMSSRIAANVTIHPYHKDLADFLEHDSKALAPADYSMHLFSNVLDIAEVQQQIPTLCDYLQSIEGQQMVIAAGPRYSSNYQGLQQLKQSLGNIAVKQDVTNFSVKSEIYSIRHNHWIHCSSYGVMMGLCFENTLPDSEVQIAA